MAPIYEPVTGRVLCVAELPLPPELSALPAAALNNAMQRYILSVSGWRKVFAADETSESDQIGDADAVLLAVAGRSIAELVHDRCDGSPPCVVVGTDSRPTGPRIADILIRTLSTYEIDVRYLTVAAAPEIMAYTKVTRGIDGFVYVTASHNPIGHNGLKFGLVDGAVLERECALELIERFRRHAADRSFVEQTVSAVRALRPDRIAAVHRAFAGWKQQAFGAYAVFVRQVIGGSGPGSPRVVEQLSAAVRAAAAGIVVDFNGSARAASIDRLFLRELGFDFCSINDRVGQIRHEIIPEGDALVPCAKRLEEEHAEKPGFSLGYVPDNDGDRGSLVVYLPGRQRVVQLPAQQGFALAVLAELAWSRFRAPVHGVETEKVAIIANDATSLRIDEIAAAFGARLFRAEVGEANVVKLAQLVRAQGYTVPILGEGSNGGTIVHPSTVRDPLTAVGSLVKLLYARGEGASTDLYAIWRSAAGLSVRERTDYSLEDVIATLPPYQTTAVTDPDAIMQLATADHALLKQRYEREFTREWESQRGSLEKRFGIVTVEQINYEGTEERRGFGPEFRSGTQRGGLKMLFRNREQEAVAFVWMRGSGTEPLFRVLADVRSHDPSDQRWLLGWHRSMVEKADR